MMRALYLCLALLAAVAAPAARQSDGAGTPDQARQQAKAERFFSHGEWLNASASYVLLCTEYPQNTGFYARAVVSQYMAGDTIGAMSVLRRSMLNDVPIDSLLGLVNTLSKQAGNAPLYRNVLTDLRRNSPWLTRNIDLRLLDYYTSRNDGPEMIRMSRQLLAASPDNGRLRMILARGYLIDELFGAAEAVWRRMLAETPDNTDVLLWLGTLYLNTGHHDTAMPLLRKAYDLRPTPYLKQLLDKHLN